MKRPSGALRGLQIVLTGFLALTAVPGGATLAAGVYTPSIELLRGTPFTTFLVPGLVLLLVIGGSSGFACALLLRRRARAASAAGLAGLFVMSFEFVEVLTIGRPSGPGLVMQLGYFALGWVLVATALADSVEPSRGTPNAPRPV